MIDMSTATLETRAALALVNFALCSGIGWSCLCRMAGMSRETTCCHYRALYVLMLVAASASGFAPVLFREWPGPGQVVLALACLSYLAASSRRWRGGPPDYARTAGAVQIEINGRMAMQDPAALRAEIRKAVERQDPKRFRY